VVAKSSIPAQFVRCLSAQRHGIQRTTAIKPERCIASPEMAHTGADLITARYQGGSASNPGLERPAPASLELPMKLPIKDRCRRTFSK